MRCLRHISVIHCDQTKNMQYMYLTMGNKQNPKVDTIEIYHVTVNINVCIVGLGTSGKGISQWIKHGSNINSG